MSTPSKELSHSEQFESWMSLYANDVLRTCYLILRDTALAEDAFQDTFLKVWKYRETFAGKNNCSARTWIVRIATNTCRDYLKSSWFRRRKSERSLDDITMPIDAPQDASEIYLDILNLPEKYRVVVILFHYQQFSKCEIAATLHISRAAVARRLTKAYMLLNYTVEEVTNRES